MVSVLFSGRPWNEEDSGREGVEGEGEGETETETDRQRRRDTIECYLFFVEGQQTKDIKNKNKNI